MALNQVGLERLNTATTKKIGTNKNIIINGSCYIAQRGVSATGSGANGFATVDRFRADQSGTDAYIEQHQVDVASGTTPYAAGLRKAFQIKNGNQTSGAGTSDRVIIMYRIEAQDIANSGWDYTSSSSHLTFSFYVKSSVAQNFYANLKTYDGTGQGYALETGSLSANTWTKVTNSIPGNSNLQFDNDRNTGLELEWTLFRGTDTTGTKSLNTWAAFNSSDRVPDMASSWYTTDDATFEVTGVQLEVGSVATDFEHRSFGDELRRCHRYFFNIQGSTGYRTGIPCYANSSSACRGVVYFPAPMRASPTFTGSTTAMVFDSAADSASFNVNTISISAANSNALFNRAFIEVSTSSMTGGQAGQLEFRASDGFMNFSSEL